MADLLIREFAGFGVAKNQQVPAYDTRAMVNQAVAIGATSASAGAATTHAVIELYAGADCHVSMDGTDATTSDYFLASGATSAPMWVPIGTTIKVKDTS